MKMSMSDREVFFFRTTLALALIVLAAALRIAPHPWNLTPIGAIALFSGAMIQDRRLAFAFPLLTLFAGDLFIGFHKLIPIVYASFLISVAIGLLLRRNRAIPRIAGATILGATQFFLLTNFGIWAVFDTYPKTSAGLASCYLKGLPLFWNTLAGDVIYVTLLFGGFALAERFVHSLREPARERV